MQSIEFLKNEEIDSNFKAKGLDEAKKNVLDVLKMEPEDRAKYEREVENQIYKESLLYTAEVKGIEKGLEEGERKGRLESTKMMIEEFGLNIEDVAKKLGIDKSETLKYLDSISRDERDLTPQSK